MFVKPNVEALSEYVCFLFREIGEDERKLRDETDAYRQACKRVKTSLADKAADYLKVLKAERQELDKEIDEIQHVAERTREGRQVLLCRALSLCFLGCSTCVM